ncbi:hypothetical protein Scep_020139 [Stephania cephalantha]|uniref:Uncharacterized protein n=1 Tax=Stephania cephalantha TaxID=152367 RepID=A0AAP0ICJ1_9MAGN
MPHSYEKEGNRSYLNGIHKSSPSSTSRQNTCMSGESKATSTFTLMNFLCSIPSIANRDLDSTTIPILSPICSTATESLYCSGSL